MKTLTSHLKNNELSEQWSPRESVSLNQSLILDLFMNRFSAIVIKNFLTHAECQELVNNAYNVGFDYYENVFPPIGRIGITQFECSKQGKEPYFQRVTKAYEKQEKIFSHKDINVIERVRGILQDAMHDKVEIAQEPGYGRYFAGLVRQINRAFLHFDYAPYDGQNWAIGDIVNQLAWNVYISSAQTGGELVVYNKPWQPTCYDTYKSANNNGSYGYQEETVLSSAYSEISAQTGDLVLFNARNFHKVNQSLPVGERISVSSFIGQLPNGKLILWS